LYGFGVVELFFAVQPPTLRALVNVEYALRQDSIGLLVFDDDMACRVIHEKREAAIAIRNDGADVFVEECGVARIIHALTGLRRGHVFCVLLTELLAQDVSRGRIELESCAAAEIAKLKALRVHRSEVNHVFDEDNLVRRYLTGPESVESLKQLELCIQDQKACSGWGYVGGYECEVPHEVQFQNRAGADIRFVALELRLKERACGFVEADKLERSQPSGI
jgi:hypothetical protein